jgi:amidase
VTERLDDRTDVCLLDALEQRALLASGQLSARDLLAAHRERIERLDGDRDAGINAVPTHCWNLAEAAADACDRRHAAGGPLPPLHGLVVGVKDLVDVAGVRTTYGSPVFADHVPEADHPLVTRLRAAGAVIVGKTNTPEFGSGSQTFNPVFGTTRNPWDLTRTVGGSSGGAAAAAAAGLVSLADGSDVGGSLRNPPAFCGVVGLRPSVGRIPNTAPGHLHARFPASGPIGRCVVDVALLLSALAGPDPRGLLSLPELGSVFAPPLGLPAATAEGRPIRVAVSDDLGGLPLEPAVRHAVRAAADRLADAGWQVEDATPPLDGVDDCFETIRGWMYAADPGGRLTPENRLRVKATVRQEIEDGERVTGADLTRAFEAETRLALGAREFLSRYDVLLTPTAQVLPFDAGTEWVREIDGTPMGRYTDWMRVCSRLTVLGVPVLSLPAGSTAPTATAPAGLPFGVQLAAAPGADLELLRIAASAETVLGRLGPPPQLSPTVS